MTRFPEYVDVDYDEGSDEGPEDYPTLEEKLGKAVEVTRTALEQYENPAVMWTGGKDSTLVLYVLLEVCDEFDHEVPPVVFIDHYEHFPETLAFAERWADRLDLDLRYARNEDFGSLGLEPGDEVPVSELNETNRRELREKLEYEGERLTFTADSYEGNHLLKTVALNNALEAHDIDGVISGVRWDEQDARADETFFSPRHDPEIYPPHDRIQPILHFDERAVWDAFWHFVVPDTVENYPEEGYVPQAYDDFPEGVKQEDIPVSPKYFEGFRSLGSEVSTQKSTDDPAWLQDVENTVEREGRAQDKEDLMGRLRDLGYM